LLQQLVRPDHGARSLWGRDGSGGIVKRADGRWFRRRFLEKAAGAFVKSQQFFHWPAQLGQTGAGLVQVGLALGRVALLECRNEDVAFSHGKPTPCGCCPSVRNPAANRANFFGNRAVSYDWAAPPSERSSQARA